MPAMLPRIDLPRALLRGRFMKAAAPIEWNGTPIDTATLALLRQYWTEIQDELIAEIDRDYGVFEGRSFRLERWERWLVDARHPLAAAGERPARPDRRHLSADGAGASSRVADAGVAQRAVRHAAGRSGGRQRRAQPHAPVGLPIAHRPLPAEQYAIHLRPERMAAKPDPATARARRRLHRLVPAGARHCGGAVRRRRDAGRLHVGRSLSRIRQAGRRRSVGRHQAHPRPAARAVQAVRPGCGLRDGSGRAGAAHRPARDRCPRPAAGAPRNLPPVLGWSDAAVDRAMLTGSISTTFGWPIHIGPNSNPRSLRNFPCQANGAEMLRLAACFATEQGIEVCALIHDAVLICGAARPARRRHRAHARRMAKASRIVLDGFELRTDVHPVRYPDRYHDPRGAVMWDRVMRLIAAREGAKQRRWRDGRRVRSGAAAGRSGRPPAQAQAQEMAPAVRAGPVAMGRAPTMHDV